MSPENGKENRRSGLNQVAMRLTAISIALGLALLPTTRADAYDRPRRVSLVSLTTSGELAQALYTSSTEWPALSADARYVAFHSSALLAPEDTNNRADIYLRDRHLGITERVSVSSQGAQGDHDSWAPRITPDGRFVAFESWASSLTPGDTGWADVFVHDRHTGSTERLSRPLFGGTNNEGAFSPSISDDGQLVAFMSEASTLVADDSNGVSDIFLRDRRTGSLSRFPRGLAGTEANAPSFSPRLSGDGQLLGFDSRASNLLLGDVNGASDAFVLDLSSGTLELLSIASGGEQGHGASYMPMLSRDGRFAAFTSLAANLVPGDTNGVWDVFVRDRLLGTTRRVSVSSAGEEGDNVSMLTGISPDGRSILFWSDSTNLVSGDANDDRDVFVHDLETGITTLVSTSFDGAGGDRMSWGIGSLTDQGREVAFMSEASNIVPGDTNGVQDVFLSERGPHLGLVSAAFERNDGGLLIRGIAAFAGDEILRVSDSVGDDNSPEPVPGGDLRGASLVYRPEQGDLLARVGLSSVAGTGALGCASSPCLPRAVAPTGVVYRVSLTVDGLRYEVRGPVLGPLGGMRLHRCDPECEDIGALEGAIGSTETELTFSLPLNRVGLVETGSIYDLEVTAELGTHETGTVQTLDELAVGNVSLPIKTVSATAGTDTFATDDFDAGGFQLAVAGPDLTSVLVWVCLGTRCAEQEIIVPA